MSSAFTRPDTSAIQQNIVLTNAKGTRLLKGLFYETSTTKEKYEPVLTLREQDYNGYTSIHQLYVQFADPSEYIFANAVLGSFDHWQMLKAADWFKPYYKKMRFAMEQRLKSLSQKDLFDAAFDSKDPRLLRQIASGDIFNGTLEDTAVPVPKNRPADNRRGRPSKEEVEGHLVAEAREEKELRELLEQAKTAAGGEDVST